MTRDNGTERNKHWGSQTVWLDVSEKSVGCSGDPGAANEPPGAGDTTAAGVFSTKYPRGETAQGALGSPERPRGPPECSAEDSVHRRSGKEPPYRIRGNSL